MSEMRLVVVGAAGRMGRMLVKTVSEIVLTSMRPMRPAAPTTTSRMSVIVRSHVRAEAIATPMRKPQAAFSRDQAGCGPS